ncbi:MAG: glycosyltransferase family 4 protein [Pseudomonadota bacterium]
MTDRLKIAYLCDITPLDPNLYSGGNARIYQALQKHAGDVTILGNGWHLAEPVRRLMHRLPEAVNLRLRWRMHLLLSRIIARGVQAELRRGKFDVLFCAYSFQSLARLEPPKGMPIAFTSDATPTTYKMSEVGQSFGSFLSASRYLDPWVTAHEARIMRRADLLLWPTEWLRGGAEQHLGVARGKAHVVPWGANIDWVDAADPGPALGPNKPLNLLFVGRDWFAKGGPMAHEVLKALLDRGIDARLTVIGTVPPEAHQHPAMQIIPQLDKSVSDEMSRFATCFRNAHFLINPSFESYGFAYCEAAAYGLPALSLNVGGVPVRNGINGHMFDADAPASDFADCIARYVKTPSDHAKLRASSRAEYEAVLNWDAWGQRAATLLRGAMRDQ